jgi:glycosyltransferase involved in cell wall biosynthesis
MINISGLIISYNEAGRIGPCIESLFKVCDEVIVVDSNSSDETVEVAEKAGARVIVQPFLGDGPQRNHGLRFCSNDWVLNLDADERLTPEAVEAIDALRQGGRLDKFEAYTFRRRNFMHGKWIRVAGSYPDLICRLFNQRKTRLSPLKAHARVESAKVRKLKADVLHMQEQNYADMVARMNLYTTWQAEAMVAEGQRATPFTPVAHALYAFLKAYFVQCGFLAGVDGLTLSLLRSQSSYFKYAKLIELRKDAASNV